MVGNANASVGGPTNAASGTVTVSGKGALLNTNGDGLAIGLLSTGSMTVSQGGSVVSGSLDDQVLSALSIGRLGHGSLTVTDAGSLFTAKGGSYIGRGGTGTLTVQNHAAMKVLLDGKGDGGLSIGNAGLTNGNTLVAGGSGSALVTTDGYLFSQTGIIVGDNGNSGTLHCQQWRHRRGNGECPHWRWHHDPRRRHPHYYERHHQRRECNGVRRVWHGDCRRRRLAEGGR